MGRDLLRGDQGDGAGMFQLREAASVPVPIEDEDGSPPKERSGADKGPGPKNKAQRAAERNRKNLAPLTYDD